MKHSSRYRLPRAVWLALLTLALVAASFYLPADTWLSSAGADTQPDFRPGAVLVGLQADAEVSMLASAMGIEHVSIRHELEHVRVACVEVPVGSELESARSLRRLPGIAFAEPDYVANAAVTPNDPEFPRQWALPIIQAPAAWELTTGSADIIIAILDTGIDLGHADLAGKVWVNPGEIPDNGIDDDGNGKIDDVHGWHFYHVRMNGEYERREDNNVQDDHGHGSHVAGIAAAATNNAIGVAGIAWEATIMPVKVLDAQGRGFYSDVAAGIIYAVDNGARILNLSLGGTASSDTLKQAVEYARSHGALVVAATGNSAGQVLYPAAFGTVLGVAATDPSDQRASTSNYGPEVALAAPGVGIFSTWRGGGYAQQSGTSMAAAHVSGAAALLWSHRNDLSVEDVERALLFSTDKLGSTFPNPYTGWGRLNVFRALTWKPSYYPLVLSHHEPTP